jgi:hypothetical protein
MGSVDAPPVGKRRLGVWQWRCHVLRGSEACCQLCCIIVAALHKALSWVWLSVQQWADEVSGRRGPVLLTLPPMLLKLY